MPEPHQRVEQTGRRYRLGQDAGNGQVAQGLDQLVAAVGGDHDDGRRPTRVVVAAAHFFIDASGDVDAVHARHLPVEQQEVEGFAALARVVEKAQTFFAGLRASDGELPAFKQVAQDGERGRLVVDDERALEVQRRQPCGAVCIPRLARGQAEAHGEREGAAAPRLAGDGDAAAHQLDELAADRQPEAGAAEAPGDAGVDLAERLEQAGGLRRREADAGVAHGDAQGNGVG